MEATMQLLKENKDVLMSVLEPFLVDPTVNWLREGRAQRGDGTRPAAGDRADEGVVCVILYASVFF